MTDTRTSRCDAKGSNPCCLRCCSYLPAFPDCQFLPLALSAHCLLGAVSGLFPQHTWNTLFTGYQPYPAGIGNLVWVSAFLLTVTEEGPVSQLTPNPMQLRLHQTQLRLRPRQLRLHPGRLALRRPGDSGSSQSHPWCDSFSADDSGQPTGSTSNAKHRRTSGRG